MKNYAEVQVFTKKSVEAFKDARRVVNGIVSYNGRYFDRRQEWIRCHEVARIVALTLRSKYKLTVVDGKFGSPRPYIEHSWLIYDECDHPLQPLSFKCFIDPYAVGRSPMVQIIDYDIGHYLYEAGKLRKDIDIRFVRQQVALARERYQWASSQQ